MRLALIVIVAGTLTGSAAAQDLESAKQPPEAPPPAQPEMRMPERRMEWSFRPRAFLGFNSGFDGLAGDVTVSRVGADLGVVIPIATMSQLALGFEYEYSSYEFSGVNGLAPGTASPFDDVQRQVFTARYGQQQTMQLSWFVAGYVGFSAEDGADLGDSVVGGVFGGVGYSLSKDLRIGGALGVFARIEDDPLVIPIPSLDWKINEQWRMSTAGKAGLSMFYSPSESWTLSLGAWYDERNFRLNEDGLFPSGAGRETSVPVEFGVVFRPTPNLELSGGAGVRWLNNYEVLNSSGNKLADVDAETSAYLTFGVNVKF